MVSRTVYLDARRLKERKEAHEYLKDMLSLPSYYGKNLDALFDCLDDLTEVCLILLHEEEAELKNSYGEKVLKVLEEGARMNPGLSLKKRTNG